MSLLKITFSYEADTTRDSEYRSYTLDARGLNDHDTTTIVERAVEAVEDLVDSVSIFIKDNEED